VHNVRARRPETGSKALTIGVQATSGGTARIALPVPSGWRYEGAPHAPGAGFEGRRARAVAPEARTSLPATHPAGAGRSGSLAAAYSPDVRLALGVSLAFEAQKLAQGGPQELPAASQALAVYQTASLRTMGFMGRLEPLDWRV